MKIPAIEFKQHDKILYLAVIKSKDLIKNAKADIWKSDHKSGYQREPSERRGKQFASYVLNGGICPMSISISFRKEKLKYKDGFLEFSDTATKWLVDGMTRTLGTEFFLEDKPSLEAFEFPVVIMNSEDEYEEAEQFYIVNKLAKRVRTDLAERFLARSIEKLGKRELGQRLAKGVLKPIYNNYQWKGKAIKIIDSLNEVKDSVWYQKIQLPNSPKADTVVAQVSFTDSLKWVLNDSFFETVSEDTIITIIDNYWKAIKIIWEEAFTDPRVYVIQRTSGVFIMHRLLPTVAQYCVDKSGRKVFTVERFKNILEKLNPAYKHPEWWSVNPSKTAMYGAGNMGTSQKIFAELAERLKDDLTLNMAESEREDIILK